jgi:hypothetical protein
VGIRFSKVYKDNNVKIPDGIVWLCCQDLFLLLKKIFALL